jgi:hypothetical protein
MKTKGQQFIEKTAQHTFQIAGKYYFKIINVNDKVISLQFNEETVYVHAYTASSFSRESSKGKQYVTPYYQNCLFPKGICYDRTVDSWEKRHSIPTFKAMKELVNEIKELIGDRNPDGVKEEIKDLILSKKMEMKK